MASPKAPAPAQAEEIDLTDLHAITNDVFYPLYWDEHRFLVLMGGAGSGKSCFTAEKICVRLMSEGKHHYVGFRKVAKTVTTSILAEMLSALERLGVRELWDLNKSAMTLTFRPNGNVFRGMGLDDAEKLKSIEGMTSAWLEEATEMTAVDLTQINLRLRGETEQYKQIVLSFNPISVYHWLKKRFFDTRADNVLTQTTTYHDNRFIDDEYKTELEALREIDKQMWHIYAKGEWGILKGLIYPLWVVDNNDYLPDRYDEVIYGLDFGFNNPSALIELAIYDKKNVHLQEMLYEPGLLTSDIVARLHEMRKDKDCALTYSSPIYGDSAEPDRIEEIARAGFNIFPSEKGSGSVPAGIDFVKTLNITTRTKNVNLNNENIMYKWAENKDGVLLEVPADISNHAMDALRYAAYSHMLLGNDFSMETM